MTKPVSVPQTFGGITTTAQLASLDADFNALAAAINDVGTYSNYFVDTGTVNAVQVSLSGGLTFSWTAGVAIDVLVANTNTVASPTITVGTAQVNIGAANGGVLPIGSMVAGNIYRFLFDGSVARIVNVIANTPLTSPLSLAAPVSGTTLSIAGASGGDGIDIALNQAPGAGWGISISGASTADVRGIQITNTTAGAAAGTIGLVVNNNGTNAMLIGKTSTAFSGAKFATGPTGEISFIWSGGAIPLVFGYGPGGSPTCAGYFGPGGGLFVNGTAVTPAYSAIGAAATQLNALSLKQGVQSQWQLYQQASDTALRVWNTTNGDAMVFAQGGNVSILGPSSGVTLTVNGVSGGTPLNCIPGGATAAIACGTPVGGGSLVPAFSIASNYAGTGASTASFSATNKPGATTGAGPAQWLVLLIGGSSYVVPAWAL